MICAAVPQLRDDGDQVLETEDVAAVLALVHHAVLLEMSAGGVGKVYHLHIHSGAGGFWGGQADIRAPTAAAAAAAAAGATAADVTRRRGAEREIKRTCYFTLLFLQLIQFGFSLHLLGFLIILFSIRVLDLRVPACVFAVGRAIVDDEQRTGEEAVGLAGFQDSLQLPEPVQHRGEELVLQPLSAVEELQ